jgi:exodeoxyribonuclease VII small subunit
MAIIMAKNQEPPDEQEATPEPLDFERALARLEEVVHLLEDGQLGLGESLGRYEEGVKLLRRAYDLLEKAERRQSDHSAGGGRINCIAGREEKPSRTATVT